MPAIRLHSRNSIDNTEERAEGCRKREREREVRANEKAAASSLTTVANRAVAEDEGAGVPLCSSGWSSAGARSIHKYLKTA